MPTYWSYLIQEMIANLGVIVIILVLLAILLKVFSNKFCYYPRTSATMKVMAEIIVIVASVLAFAALFTSFVEQLDNNMLFSVFLLFFSVGTAFWIDR
jgi:cytochrome b561